MATNTNSPHRQNFDNSSNPVLRKRQKIVNPAVVAVQRLNFLFRQNGFTPVFSPSLETDNGNELKKIYFDREDIKNINNSNYPLILYNRTPLVKSQRISGERTFDVIGPERSLMTYTHGEFTLRLLSLFNSQELLEEYETSYLLCGINTESLHLYATLPPVGILESLDEYDRRFIIDLNWKDFSDIKTERNDGKYEFAVASSVEVLTTYFNISDPDTVRMLSSLELNFYWDKEFTRLESEWKLNREDTSVTYHNNTDGEITQFPYVHESHPEYEKTEIIDANVELTGFIPLEYQKGEIKSSEVRYGSIITEMTYSYTLNSEKFMTGGVTLNGIDNKAYGNIENPFNVKLTRENYIEVLKDLTYTFTVQDKYEKKLSLSKFNISVTYPVCVGILGNNNKVMNQVNFDFKTSQIYYTKRRRFIYGSSSNGYLYYAYPKLLGEIIDVELIPSKEKVPMVFLGEKKISSCALSGRKTKYNVLIYYVYISKDKLEEPISVNIM